MDQYCSINLIDTVNKMRPKCLPGKGHLALLEDKQKETIGYRAAMILAFFSR